MEMACFNSSTQTHSKKQLTKLAVPSPNLRKQRINSKRDTQDNMYPHNDIAPPLRYAVLDVKLLRYAFTVKVLGKQLWLPPTIKSFAA